MTSIDDSVSPPGDDLSITQALHRIRVSTDQGSGGSYCSGCQSSVERDYCDKCDQPLRDTPIEPYEFGGSDFF